MRLLALTLGCVFAAAAADSGKPAEVTFYKDVLPVLQNNCQTCHRPGEVAPMSFLSYSDTRPWAKAIKAAVLTKKMPPWFASPAYGHFRNERKLTEDEKRTLIAWADSGAPEGNPKDKPAPVSFLEGWNIKPDIVFEMPNAFEVPATGIVEYTYIVIPTNFTKDTWVTAGELRPGNRSVMHHVIAYVRPPGSEWLKDAKPGVPYVPRVPERDANGAVIRRKPSPEAIARARQSAEQRGNFIQNENLCGYAPGLPESRFDIVPGAAKLIPAGSDIVFQLHYTPKGKATTDKTKLGLTLATETPKYRYLTSSAATQDFEIPANDPNYEVRSSITTGQPVQLVWLMPHMHFRGKDFLFNVVYPTGEKQTLLDVPRYDFNWQLGYEEAKPLVLPTGTRIECTAHFDNSKNNPANPNSDVSVRWGDQTWEEMMIGFVGVVFDASIKPEDVIIRPQQQRRPVAGAD